jgi:hypothetical protein
MKIDYSEASQEIQVRHFFTRKEPSLAGFHRFFSADPRFPLSIVYPHGLSPHYHDTEYLHTLSVTFGPNTFSVIHTDYTQTVKASDQSEADLSVPRSNSLLIQNVLKTTQQWSDFGEALVLKHAWIHEGEEELAIVGNPGFKAARIIWDASNHASSEWVIFQVGLTLWTISKHPESCLSPEIFKTLLRSFRFLDDTFFASLGIKW